MRDAMQENDKCKFSVKYRTLCVKSCSSVLLQCVLQLATNENVYYGVATISRPLTIIGLFCRI